MNTNFKSPSINNSPSISYEKWLYTIERQAIIPIKWCIWLLCLVLSVLTTPGHLPPLSIFNLLIFYAMGNVLFSYFFYRAQIPLAKVQLISFLSLAFDVGIMSTLIFLTGGLHSDFYLLFFLVILRAAGFFRTAWQNFLADLVISLLYLFSILISEKNLSFFNQKEFYARMCLMCGVIILSWFLIKILAAHKQRIIEMNRRLALQSEYNRNLLNSMSSGVIAINDNFRITTVNPAAKKILQLTNLSPGQKLDTIIELSGITRLFLNLKERKLEHNDFLLEIPQPNKKPSLSILCSTRAIHSPQNQLLGMVCVFKDISEMRRMEEQLLRQEKLASVGHLAAGVAHELGNPISIIKSCAAYLQNRKDLSPEYSEEIAIISSEALRCEAILKQMLSLAQPQQYEWRELSLREVTNRSLALVKYHNEAKGLNFNFNCPQESYVMGDDNLLTQVLVNILLNAVQAMQGKKGTITINVGQKTTDEKPEAMVSITDQGVGIAEENIPHLFDPFFTTRDTGTGLGLSVTARIIELLQGRIEVQSLINVGTTFYIYLPLVENKTNL